MDITSEQRRNSIIFMAEQNGTVEIKSLSEHFNVSQRTIRRDIEKLEQQGLLCQIQGGALWLGSNPKFDRNLASKTLMSAEKFRIAEYVSKTVKDEETVILDSGSTTLQIAKYISDKKNLVVVTNSIDIASVLCNSEEIITLMPGGIIRRSTRSLVGPKTVEFFKNIWADRLFLGINGISVRWGLTNSNPYETSVKKAMINSAKEVIVVTDRSKIGNNSMESFASLGEIDCLITDNQADESQLRAIQEAGVRIIVV
jgi:DeoR/GlpR family transcriptional regulator of sugar metabolism